MTPPGPYIEYWRLTRIATYIWLAAILLSSVFSPLPHALLSVRILIILMAGLAIGLWIAANVRYVLAWDELQRRALAESGAITALVLTSMLLFDALLERLFQTPHVPALIWPIAGIAIWAVALPLIRKHYEA